jgi:hypothetical protein
MFFVKVFWQHCRNKNYGQYKKLEVIFQMNSKLEMAMDSVTVANGIMQDIIDVDRMEKMLECELSSSDLFKIDCAILSHLRKTTDFSRDLLEQLEAGRFETVAVKPPKSYENDLQNIQREAIVDIAIQGMFDEMTDIVSDALRS